MVKKILIIEDDKDTSEMLEYLGELLHFEVTCSLLKLSVTEVEILAPDLILLDYHLQGGLGSQLCIDLKSNASTQHIPIILMSAANNLAQIAGQSRADGFFPKPFDLKDLEKSIIKHIC